MKAEIGALPAGFASKLASLRTDLDRFRRLNCCATTDAGPLTRGWGRFIPGSPSRESQRA